MSYTRANTIIHEECTSWGIADRVLRSGRRTATVAQCRRVIIDRLLLETKLSLREIGLAVGLKTAVRATTRRNYQAPKSEG